MSTSGHCCVVPQVCCDGQTSVIGPVLLQQHAKAEHNALLVFCCIQVALLAACLHFQCTFMLAGLPKLQPMLHAAAPLSCRTTLLKLLSAIFALDAGAALNPTTNTGFNFLFTAYRQLLAKKGSHVQQRQLLSQALQLLGSVLLSLQQHLQQQAAREAIIQLREVLSDIVDSWGVNVRNVKR